MISTLYPIFRRWSERGSVYLSSDTHLDDADRNSMGYTISEQEQIDIIKSMAHKSDTFIHLGDVGNPEYLRQIKAYKVLIMGNHDQSAKRFEQFFDEIYTGPLFISDKILLSHEPIYGMDFVFNIHGHDHNPKNKGDANHLNLASNVYGYQPLNLSQFIRSGALSCIKDIHRQTIDDATEKKLLLQAEANS